jgi:hypothetical protein
MRTVWQQEFRVSDVQTRHHRAKPVLSGGANHGPPCLDAWDCPAGPDTPSGPGSLILATFVEGPGHGGDHLNQPNPFRSIFMNVVVLVMVSDEVSDGE